MSFSNKKLYNILFRYSDIENFHIGLNEEQLYSVLEAIKERKKSFNIIGKETNLTFKEIKIYDNEKALNKTDRSCLVDEINKSRKFYGLKTNLDLMNFFGYDLTHMYKLDIMEEPIYRPEVNQCPSIFISHSSLDVEIVDEFVERILINGCAIQDNEIFCTSLEGLGIKNGEDFRKHIRESLIGSKIVILLISENYKKSEICLNEMGAAWALLEKDVMPILLPGCSFQQLGFLYSVKQGGLISNGAILDELHEKLKRYSKKTVTLVRWNKLKADFLKAINNGSNIIHNKAVISVDHNSFFEEFLKPNISINSLLLQAQPTLRDCQIVFSNYWSKKYYDFYHARFNDLVEKLIPPLYPGRQFYHLTTSNTNEMTEGINKIAGGLTRIAQNGVFNSNIDLVEVTFTENQSELIGLSFKVFSYINGRWVFFPKPQTHPDLKIN